MNISNNKITLNVYKRIIPFKFLDIRDFYKYLTNSVKYLFLSTKVTMILVI